jgi:UDP-N-acetyl-D-mannosaminuronate dehydrogenase
VAAEGTIAKPLMATTEAWVAILGVGYVGIDVAIDVEDERRVVGPSKVMMETEEGDSVEKVKEEVMEVGTASRGVVKLT